MTRTGAGAIVACFLLLSSVLFVAMPLAFAAKSAQCCQEEPAADAASQPTTNPSTTSNAPFVMTVFTDKYAYDLSDSLVATVQLRSVVTYVVNHVTINSSVVDSNDTVVLRLPTLYNESLDALVIKDFDTSASFALDDANYVVVATAIVNGSVISRASIPLVVLNTATKQPLTLAMVFHMHQPIYLNLEGQFEQPWVQVHTGGDFQYNGSWYGAYLWYIVMLERHPDVNVTINLQPSLLYQLNASMNDFSYNGTFPYGQQALATDLAAVKPTVDGYRQLASEGRIEILTSPFYHPLSAILVQLRWSSDLIAQISLGKNYTENLMGVDPQGMWTPEMGFTMAMVPMMANQGLRYTILDQVNQFDGAQGPSASSSLYQPFILEGANGSHIIVFFRDTAISNDLFHTWVNEPNSRVAASDFIAAVANVYRKTDEGVLTLALDGENPIVEGSEVLSAIDMDAILGAIGSQSWLKTSTLAQVLAERNVSARLTSVPNGTWSDGFGIWIGSPPKNAIWEAISKARSTLVNLTQRYGRDNPEIAKLWNYLYVAEGSDWEFQTELPWFVMQGLRYANAAETYVPTSTATATSTSTTSSLTYSAYLIPLVVVVIVVVAVVSFAALRSRRRR